MVVLHVFRRKGEGKDLRVFVFLRNDKRNKLVASFTVVCRPRDSLQSFLRFSPSLFSFFLFSRPCLVTFSRQFSRLLSSPPPPLPSLRVSFPIIRAKSSYRAKKMSYFLPHSSWLVEIELRAFDEKEGNSCSTRFGSIETSPMISDYFSSVNFRPIENRLWFHLLFDLVPSTRMRRSLGVSRAKSTNRPDQVLRKFARTLPLYPITITSL